MGSGDEGEGGGGLGEGKRDMGVGKMPWLSSGSLFDAGGVFCSFWFCVRVRCYDYWCDNNIMRGEKGGDV